MDKDDAAMTPTTPPTSPPPTADDDGAADRKRKAPDSTTSPENGGPPTTTTTVASPPPAASASAAGIVGAIPWRPRRTANLPAATPPTETPPPPRRRPGNPIEEGDLVVVYERFDRMKAVRVERGGKLQNRYGIFEHDEWIDGLEFGSVAYAKNFSRGDVGRDGKRKAGFVYVLKPNCELWTLVLPHRTQILYVADISTVVMQLRLRPGAVVLESGTGSGSLTHALYRAVAPTGRVFTYEYHKVRADKARDEFATHGVDLRQARKEEGDGAAAPDEEKPAAEEATTIDRPEGGGVWVEQRDIEQLGFPTDGCHGFAPGTADAVFLDLPGPWKAVPSATACLKFGGVLCSFSPCIEQVKKTVQAMTEENAFYRMRTMEVILRPYELRRERVRDLVLGQGAATGDAPPPRTVAIPSENVRGHTGYLTFAQKVKCASP